MEKKLICTFKNIFFSSFLSRFFSVAFFSAKIFISNSHEGLQFVLTFYVLRQ